MSAQWTDRQRELDVSLAQRKVPHGRLVDASMRELAGEIFAGLAEAGEWQFTGVSLLAHLQSSAQDAGGRAGDRARVDLRSTFEQPISNRSDATIVSLNSARSVS